MFSSNYNYASRFYSFCIVVLLRLKKALLKNILVNPFFVYIYSFLGVLAVYSLDWSNLYPRLSLSTSLFFLVTFVISLIIGIWIHNQNLIVYSKIDSYRTIKVGTSLVILILTIEIIYNREIPLVKILAGQEYDFRNFSFPLLPHLLGTLAPFLATISFHSFLSKRRKSLLLFCLLNTAPGILLFHRSVVIIILLNCIFVFILSGGLQNIKKLIILIILFISIMYLFGIAGNVRTKSQIGDGKDFIVTMLMSGTEAKPEAYDSELAQNFYWFYLYAASPLANFQNTINKSKKYDLNFYNINQLLTQEICPDILSKRINTLSGKEEFQSPLERIVYFLTVGTIYADSFVYLGWFGPMLMYVFLSLIILAFIFLLRHNQYFVASLATLSTMVFLSIFSNMVVYTPLSFQLLYPLIVPTVSSCLNFLKLQNRTL